MIKLNIHSIFIVIKVIDMIIIITIISLHEIIYSFRHSYKSGVQFTSLNHY